MKRTDENDRPVDILLVEDNQDDVFLTREGFKRSGLSVNLHNVRNGEMCLAYLRKQGGFADVPTPELILLDLNMPILSGQEVLAELVKDEALMHLPVIILTTSSDPGDVLKLFRLRCSAYVTKPVNFNEFQNVVQSIADFWFKVVVRPRTE